MKNEEHICDYGCNKPGLFQLKNKKWCCEDHYSKCNGYKNKNKDVKKYIKIENIEGKICDYGCGTVAKFKSKGGKYCCEDHYNKCPFLRDKMSNKLKLITYDKPVKIENKEGKLCDNGCRKVAKYQFKNKKLCCSDHYTKCKVNKDKHSKKMKGRTIKKAEKIENPENKLCDYGCGLRAEYELKNKKLCCSDHWASCKESMKINKKASKLKSKKGERIENPENKLCDYGCRKVAKYQFKNKKLCCSEYIKGCIIYRNKSSKVHSGKIISKKTRKKLREYNLGKRHSKETKEKMSNSHKYSIEDWQEKYPTFTKEEELRYNPENGNIQGHCKYNNCKNSKDNNGWFDVTTDVIYGRAISLEHPEGNDGSYFYCCDKCKKLCPLYHLHGDPYTKTNSPYTQEEYNIWRQEVLIRQFNELGHNECEICKNKDLTELQVHHEIPTKKNWIFSLDPDNGIILCVRKERQPEEESCHFKYGHKTGTECSTGNLANRICI